MIEISKHPLSKSGGELQLITGGVGTGKSLFARRYKEFLQPKYLQEHSHWAFVDFNPIKGQLENAHEWVYRAFCQSLVEEGAPINLRDPDDQERVFASDLGDREAYYQRVERVEKGRGALEMARDLEEWRHDPERLAKGFSRYLQGEKGALIIVVFDNVDRRDVGDQLTAFQLAMWFMASIRCLVLLQMRDTTFEAHKNEPPLDTYKTGQIFHISPPRFIDVVKRRLELSVQELSKHVPTVIKYKTRSGTNISYPRAKAGEFLNVIYLELFKRSNNTTRILEAVAGRNVRKALDIFFAIVTSGHMPEEIITCVAMGSPMRGFQEHLVLRVLMRQDYRFYNDNVGFIANIFFCDMGWQRPSNFLVAEALFYLVKQSRFAEDNGLLGFVSVGRLTSNLEQLGYLKADVEHATQYLFQKELIEADSLNSADLNEVSSVKASASGWAHMRLLSSSLEYVAALLPSTAINDAELEVQIFATMQVERDIGRLSLSRQTLLVHRFSLYLRKQFDVLKVHPGYEGSKQNGALYVLQKVSEAVDFGRNVQKPASVEADWLD